MMTRWRGLAAGAFLIAVCGPVDAEPPGLPPLLKPLDLRGYAAGTMPPPFAGRTLDGQLSMMDVRGKVVFVNFWASWCAECRPEMPVLDRLHREFGAQGFAVVGVNAREPATVVRRYVAALGLTFPVVLDADGTINGRYGVVGLPATFIVGRDGRAVAFAVGARAWDSGAARTLIETLLAEPAGR